MKLVIIADRNQQSELRATIPPGTNGIIWLQQIYELQANDDPEAVIDMTFQNDPWAVGMLETLLPRPVIVHEVCSTLEKIGKPFIRINAWPGFLMREIWEVAGGKEADKINAEKVFGKLNKKVEWVADTPGLVSARVIAMIINEAYLALQEQISTKEEIDIAMKTGTSYPHGPFEWAAIIGLKNIAELLFIMSKRDKKYQPAEMLLKEAGI